MLSDTIVQIYFSNVRSDKHKWYRRQTIVFNEYDLATTGVRSMTEVIDKDTRMAL